MVKNLTEEDIISFAIMNLKPSTNVSIATLYYHQPLIRLTLLRLKPNPILIQAQARDEEGGIIDLRITQV